MATHGYNIARLAKISAVTLALGSIAVEPAGAKQPAECLEFDTLSIILEQNATDGDSEVVMFAKGQDDGLAKLSIFDPNGRKVSQFNANAEGVIGIREFSLESPEPADAEIVLAAFPEGTYRFTGRTKANNCLRGEATLSQQFAPETEILTPAEDEVVDPGLFVVTWMAVPEAVSYLVEIKNEDRDDTLQVEVYPPSTGFDVPAGWLVNDTEYEVTVATKTSSGNVTSVQIAVFTSP